MRENKINLRMLLNMSNTKYQENKYWQTYSKWSIIKAINNKKITRTIFKTKGFLIYFTNGVQEEQTCHRLTFKMGKYYDIIIIYHISSSSSSSKILYYYTVKYFFIFANSFCDLANRSRLQKLVLMCLAW